MICIERSADFVDFRARCPRLLATSAQVVARCDMATFAFLVRSLDAGLKSLDVSISSQCAAAVDNLAGFFFKGCAEEAPAPAAQVTHRRRISASVKLTSRVA